ncbi:serine protease Do [Arboricoccus pini]|uniref:Serine protease Do n=2 Tax=Arboricoccus pini TaxID=1963835 RepID=A0A212QTM4_9PROT|nr:serine protease Do [Arboricoccus pini]
MLSFAPIVRKVAPAVVSVTTRRTALESGPLSNDPLFQYFFKQFGVAPSRPQPRTETSLGSGVIVRSDGVIVTNHHVIDGADDIQVVLADRRVFPARVLTSDQGSDLAFLKIDAGAESLPVIELGDSDQLEVGDLVLAIGNPFGIGQTVTSGIVSAIGRSAPTLDRNSSFIQTDAAINPGNSGGALVTMDGRLIGINTAIFTRGGGSIGIGFAIPSNLVRIREQTLTSGLAVSRPWLGADMQDIDPDKYRSYGLDRPEGVLLARIYPGSPADKAGLKPDDVVTAIDGVEVDDPLGLDFRLALKAAGSAARLTVIRGGAQSGATVAILPASAEPPADLAKLADDTPLGGMQVANMSPAFNEEQGFDMFGRGVVVLGIAPRSPATQLELRRGDVIETINGQDVRSVEDLQRITRTPVKDWVIDIRRDGERGTIAVQAVEENRA